MNRLKWAQDHKVLDWKQVTSSDETTIRLNCVTRLLWNLPRKKIMRTVKHPIKVNVSGYSSSKGFDRIVCFKQNLNAGLMCDVSKRGLVPTARKQFGHNSTLWKLQRDNESKNASKLAVNWKRNNGVHEIYCLSMSSDLAPMENIWQLLKMNLRRKKIESYQPLISAINREWELLPSELTNKLVHSMNSRISEIIESHGGFILG